MRIRVKPKTLRSKDRPLQNWAGLKPGVYTKQKQEKCTGLKTGYYTGVASQGAAMLRPYKHVRAV